MKQTICSIWSRKVLAKVVAVELQRLGCEVIAVDKDMERLEHICGFCILCYAGRFW